MGYYTEIDIDMMNEGKNYGIDYLILSSIDYKFIKEFKNKKNDISNIFLSNNSSLNRYLIRN
jgi:fructoselysine-6-P-deglycase FrlB-like protein